jgi:methionyl-tRNA synthetase
MLVEKSKNFKLHGIVDILAFVDSEKHHKDALSWLVSSFRPEQPGHINHLKTLYSPSQVSLLNLIVYRTLKNFDDSITHEELEKAITAAAAETKKIEQQSQTAPVDKAAPPKQNAPAKKVDEAPKAPKAGKKKGEDVPQEYLDFIASAKLKRSNKGKPIPLSKTDRNVLITSALPYVNNEPHLGNLIGAVLSADVFARFSRQMGYNTVYICGTDEYGTATETKALLENKTPKQICDHYNKLHTEIYEHFDIDFDYFGRTSTPKHAEVVQEIFLKCDKNEYIIKKTVDQLYCDNCSRFIADRFAVGKCPKPTCDYEKASGDQCDKCGGTFEAYELLNPKCIICSKAIGLKTSEHLFLDLEKVDPELQQFVDNTSNKKGTWTNNSVAITQGWFKQGLKARCITRDLKWGVPVPKPGFEDKCFYVWFDAPIGYISITACFMDDWKDWWTRNNDVELFQFMGKDNVPFHTILFPGFLLATKQEWTLLKHISTTEYLNYEEEKFSKRNSIGVFGGDVMKLPIPTECWRYYLLSVRPETSDTQFRWIDFATKVNNDLLANFGNLCNRILKFIYSNCEKKIPSFDASKITALAKKTRHRIFGPGVEDIH